MATDNYKAVGGGVAAVVNANWARRTAPRKAVDWGWQAQDEWTSGQRLTPKALRLLQEIMRRLGEIQGMTVPQLVESVGNVQAEVSQAQTAAAQASSKADAADARIDVVREVAVGAGLPGAGSIPP